MIRQGLLFLNILLLSLLSGCDRPEEELDGRYKISGTIYAQTSDTPLVNAPLKIQGFRDNSLSGDDYIDLGTTTTDAEGFFSFTYDQHYEDDRVRFGEGHWIELSFDQVVGGQIEQLPWNKDISRDFAQHDHSRLYVEIRFVSQVRDSIYFGLHDIFDNPDIVNVKAPEITENFSAPAIATAGQHIVQFECKLNTGGTWDNEPRLFNYGYAFGSLDFKDLLIANFFDSIPDDPRRGEYELHGFPFVDTIKLEL